MTAARYRDIVTSMVVRLADILDLMHIPGIVILGAMLFWAPTRVFAVRTWAVITALQIACLGCPLVLLTAVMRGRRDVPWGITYYIFHQYGRAVGLVTLLPLIYFGWICGKWRWKSGC